MERFFIAVAAAAGALAVVADAAAQHYLAGDAARAALAATGARYGLIHAVALLGVALLLELPASGFGRVALALSGWSFVVALVAFCGGLYLHAAGAAAFAAIVPVGGTLFIAGWVLLFVHAVSPRPLA
ncbi:MAG TPA: DUF423 domain-containing protein [Stellaceae bacterium]|nr:DUF423 domain-containing protein [Stellaceae bacterium]